jgi:hypothetical protein
VPHAHPSALEIRRGQQRLGRDLERQVGTQIHDEQTIVAILPEKAQHKRLGADHRAVDFARTRAEDGVAPLQVDEVSV